MASNTVTHTSHTDGPMTELDDLCDEFMHDLDQYTGHPELDDEEGPDQGTPELQAAAASQPCKECHTARSPS
jgi:hypothetical protein